MPIYEYQCAKCGYLFEKLQKMSDPAISTCPQCQAEQVKKLISHTSFQLKGTGWYVTDFKDSDKKRAKAKQDQQKQASGTGTSKNNASNDTPTSDAPATSSTPKTDTGKDTTGTTNKQSTDQTD
jgi:putative FmdB family regulatory protein